MGDQIVTLEHKADAVIAVSVPVLVLVQFCGTAVDHEVARRVVVKTSDDVEKSRLAAARRAEDRDELALAERKIDPLESVHDRVADGVVLGNVLQCKH